MWGGGSASLRQPWVGSPANCLNLLALICKMAVFCQTDLTELLLKANKTILSTVPVQSDLSVTDFVITLLPHLCGLLVT